MTHKLILLLLLNFAVTSAGASTSYPVVTEFYNDSATSEADQEFVLSASDEEALLYMVEFDELIYESIQYSSPDAARKAIDMFKESYDQVKRSDQILEEAAENLRHIRQNTLSPDNALDKRRKLTLKKKRKGKIPRALKGLMGGLRKMVNSESKSQRQRGEKIKRVPSKSVVEATIEAYQYVKKQAIENLGRKSAWIISTLMGGDIKNDIAPDSRGMVPSMKYHVELKKLGLKAEVPLIHSHGEAIPIMIRNIIPKDLLVDCKSSPLLIRIVQDVSNGQHASYMPLGCSSLALMSVSNLDAQLQSDGAYSSLTSDGDHMVRQLVYNQLLVALAYGHHQVLVDMDFYYKLNIDPGIVLSTYRHYAEYFGAIDSIRTSINSIVLFFSEKDPDTDDYIFRLENSNV